jgi:hypothetical protein
MLFLRQQESSLQKTLEGLDSAQQTVENAIKAIAKLQKSLVPLSLPEEDEYSLPSILSATPEPIQKKSEVPRPLVLNVFEERLTNSYNDDPSKFRKTFLAEGFGTENVSDIFQTGGEPKFIRKEGGIYYLVEDQGSSYVVPDPTSPLNDSYIKSEGLAYLFDIEDYDMEKQPLVALERPALVKESSGHWTVSNKGKIRGRL